ncbi:MAG: XRE family transcriptional regulator [Oscillospiraceae bacterium]|nr:XRE family transcriptional regulator [Oscillospiraceae bacterium]
MSKQATKAIGNVYCQARLKAAQYNEKLRSRAGAAEVIPGVSEDSIKKYELDITRPPNDVVALMADAYNAPELRAWYCTHECPLGRDCREIKDMPPERALIRARNTIKQLELAIQSFAEIVDDGIIDENEMTEIPALREQFLEARRRLDENLAVFDKIEKKGSLE